MPAEALTSKMPRAVLRRIAAFLPAHGDRAKMLVVSKEWSRAAAEHAYAAPRFASAEQFERLTGTLAAPPQAQTHPYGTLITELRLAAAVAANLEMGDIDCALRECPQLRVFRLEKCIHMSNLLIKSLAQLNPSLVKLELPGCPISDAFIPELVKGCRHLKTLDLSFTNVSTVSLKAILEHSAELDYLDMTECRAADDVSFDVVKKFDSPLRWLNLRNSAVTDEIVDFVVSHAPALKVLILESCAQVTDRAVARIAEKLPVVRHLDFSFSERITEKALRAIATCKNIEFLYLAACDAITPRGVLEMVKRTRKLELLVLDGCDQIVKTFVQTYCKPRDPLECTLQGKEIRRLAAHVLPNDETAASSSGGRSSRGPSPKSSPTPVNLPSQFKFKVNYGSNRASNEPAGKENAAPPAFLAGGKASPTRSNGSNSDGWKKAGSQHSSRDSRRSRNPSSNSPKSSNTAVPASSIPPPAFSQQQQMATHQQQQQVPPQQKLDPRAVQAFYRSPNFSFKGIKKDAAVDDDDAQRNVEAWNTSGRGAEPGSAHVPPPPPPAWSTTPPQEYQPVLETPYSQHRAPLTPNSSNNTATWGNSSGGASNSSWSVSNKPSWGFEQVGGAQQQGWGSGSQQQQAFHQPHMDWSQRQAYQQPQQPQFNQQQQQPMPVDNKPKLNKNYKRVYSSQSRGRHLLKMKIETTDGRAETLVIHEFDDPMRIASDFCRTQGMEEVMAALAKQIQMRKSAAIRQRAMKLAAQDAAEAEKAQADAEAKTAIA